MYSIYCLDVDMYKINVCANRNKLHGYLVYIMHHFPSRGIYIMSIADASLPLKVNYVRGCKIGNLPYELDPRALKSHA